MIGSRAIVLARNLSKSPFNKGIQKRWSHGDWEYRPTKPNPPAWAKRGATISACMVYWWIYWNLWHDWPHLVGLYYGKFLPNPREFTDEELGLPPED